jgi:periplasmic divalent cation tolerance protein
MTDKIIVFSTCDTEAEARQLATHLVEARLAACVNVIPGVRSVYWWRDKVEETNEFLLIIKSARSLFAKLQAELARMHSYSVPEAIALPIVDGSLPYLSWLDRELQLHSGDKT